MGEVLLVAVLRAAGIMITNDKATNTSAQANLTGLDGCRLPRWLHSQANSGASNLRRTEQAHQLEPGNTLSKNTVLS